MQPHKVVPFRTIHRDNKHTKIHSISQSVAKFSNSFPKAQARHTARGQATSQTTISEKRAI